MVTTATRPVARKRPTTPRKPAAGFWNLSDVLKPKAWLLEVTGAWSQVDAPWGYGDVYDWVHDHTGRGVWFSTANDDAAVGGRPWCRVWEVEGSNTSNPAAFLVAEMFAPDEPDRPAPPIRHGAVLLVQGYPAIPKLIEHFASWIGGAKAARVS